MVRGPAAVLGGFGAALAYFEIAPSLPALSTLDATVIASGAAAVIALAGCALALVPLRDSPLALVLLAGGGAMIAGALTAADVGAGANVAKLLFAAGLGMLLAWTLAVPEVVIAVPLFVAVLDAASVFGGPTSVLIRDQPRTIEYISFSIPRWGGGGALQLGLGDLVFLAFYAAAAWRHGFRRRVTAGALMLALVVAVVAGVLFDRALPVLPALTVALLLPNLDRIRPMFERERGG